MSTRDIQVGGTHYKDFPIEPVDYITKNGLDWYTGNIVKYASRYKLKGGADDIKKVIHYAAMILEDKYDIHARIEFLDHPAPKKAKRKNKKNANKHNNTTTTSNPGTSSGVLPTTSGGDGVTT